MCITPLYSCTMEYQHYRLKVVLEYLQKSMVKVFDLPGNTPDLNPIVTLWSYIMNKVEEKQPSSTKELVTAIKEVWEKKISTYCALVKSMPSCLATVVQEKGGHTKY